MLVDQIIAYRSFSNQQQQQQQVVRKIEDHLYSLKAPESSSSSSLRNMSTANQISDGALCSASFLHTPSQRNERRTVVVINVTKIQRGILNPAFISIALISYIIFNQSITTIMSAGRNLTNSERIESLRGPRLVGLLVAADPSPAPTKARSATSGSHRANMPPINGSIFGKRSVSSLSEPQARVHHHVTSGTLAIGEDDGKHDSPIPPLETLQQQQQQQQQQRQRGSSRSQPQQAPSPSTTSTTNQHSRVQRPPSALARSEASNYKDIITGIIEDFLALNNESNPEEASVAFCRMIVYECSEMLSARSKALARQRKRKRTQTAASSSSSSTWTPTIASH